MTSKEHKQLIQNFLNCCIMETQGEILTHDDLAKLLEFYFSEDEVMYCEGLSCYQNNSEDNYLRELITEAERSLTEPLISVPDEVVTGEDFLKWVK